LARDAPVASTLSTVDGNRAPTGEGVGLAGSRHLSGERPGYCNKHLYVHYLRKKLDRDGEPSRIRTVHGAGYTFDPRPQP
jgi:hypothetical protein